MSAPNSERTSIGDDAEGLGWKIRQAQLTTVYAYGELRLTVWFSDNGYATKAQLVGADGKVLADREFYDEGRTVGDWVRVTLRTWRIEYEAAPDGR